MSTAQDDVPAPLVDLIVEDGRWLDALPELAAIAETAARAALEGAGVDPADREIALLACDDGRIAALNQQFRDKAGPTNVLSWPALTLARDAGSPPALPPQQAIMLGDIAIAFETTRDEAQVASRPLKDHTLHLILHGCLHLLGYDHVADADAVLMEGIERRQLAALGMADPYSGGEAG